MHHLLGLIYSRSINIDTTKERSKYDEDTPQNELLYPEFVEVIARAAYYKYFIYHDDSDDYGEGTQLLRRLQVDSYSILMLRKTCRR
jgi:hypothetical protein